MQNGTYYYKTLGVESNATDQEIKAAYRRGALTFHPDRTGNDPEAAEKMKVLNEAYAVLSDQAKRKEYDLLKYRFGDSAHSHFRQSHSYQDIFSGSDIESIFEELARSFGLRGFDELFKNTQGTQFRTFTFGDSGVSGRGYFYTGSTEAGNRQRETPPTFASRGTMKLAGRFFKKMTGLELPITGDDIKDTIHISRQLASEGGTFDYHIQQRQKTLAVKLPPQVREGQQVRLAGMGKEGTGGAPPGDLYLTVKTKKSVLEKATSFLSWIFK